MLVCSFKVILPGAGIPLSKALQPAAFTLPVATAVTPSVTPSDGGEAVSVTTMTPSRYRRPLMISAAAIALLSLIAVGAVMALAFAGSAAPVWVTSTALYGLPLAFLLMVFLVLDSVAGRRRAGKSGGR